MSGRADRSVPASLDATLAELAEQAASTTEDTSAQAEAARARIADCDRKIAQYRASLDAGGDPVVIGPWIAEIQAKRVAAQHPHTRNAAPLDREHGRADSCIQTVKASKCRGRRAVNIALTVGRRPSWRGLLASLAAFWPHKYAQRCRLLCISEYHFGSQQRDGQVRRVRDTVLRTRR